MDLLNDEPEERVNDRTRQLQAAIRELKSEIAERKLVEDALSKSEERFARAFHANPAAIVISLLEDGRVVDVNDSLLKLFGLERHEVIGRTSTELGWWQGPAERLRFIEALRERGSLRCREVQLRTKSGAPRDIILSTEWIDVGGQECLLTMFQDITDRKKSEEALRVSEEQYRLLFERNPHPMWVVDPETLAYLAVNEAAVRQYGYSREEFAKMTLEDLRPSEDVPALLNHFSRVVNSESPEVGIRPAGVWRHRKKDGTIIDVEVTRSHIAFRGRNAVLGLGTDITERLRAEEDLKLSRQQLRALSARIESIREEEKALLAREIHDEFGQVLTALKMSLVTVSRRLSSVGDPVIASVLERLEAMSRTIDSTVDRIRRIALDLRPDLLDNLGLIAAIEWYAAEFQARTGITCVAKLPDVHLAIDKGHGTALFRILQETLTNVARHAGATIIDICLSRNVRDLVLEVRDNGRGITEAEITGSRSLGLLGMKERSLLLNGELKIQGVPGKGTIVCIRVPLRASEDALAPAC